MTTITIITIVVIALLTATIFGLAWLGYKSCLKLYKIEVYQGKHDEAIHAKKKKTGLIGLIGSYLALLALLGLFTTGIIYKASGENISIGNQTALVIKSGSMSDFYDDKIAEKYNYDKSLQFDVGDICWFEAVDELIEGNVYGYKYKNITITHRLTHIRDDGFCEFRGDNNPVSDALVPIDNIVYHYTGNKIPGVGAFVLYSQSYFGLWSLCGIIGITVSSEVVYYQVHKIEKEYLGGDSNEK